VLTSAALPLDKSYISRLSRRVPRLAMMRQAPASPRPVPLPPITVRRCSAGSLNMTSDKGAATAAALR